MEFSDRVLDVLGWICTISGIACIGATAFPPVHGNSELSSFFLILGLITMGGGASTNNWKRIRALERKVDLLLSRKLDG